MTDIKLSGGGKPEVNVEALIADKTVVMGTDKMYQRFSCVTNKYVDIDITNATEGDRLVITNTNAYNSTQALRVRLNAQPVDYIYADQTKRYLFDGTNLVSEDIAGGLYTNSQTYSFGIGQNSKASGYGTAVGHLASSGLRSTAIGNNATSTGSYGLAIGRSAFTSGSSSIAIGYQADCNSATNSIAIGMDSEISSGRIGSIAIGENADANNSRAIALGQASKTSRCGETVTAISMVSLRKSNKTLGTWTALTSDATPLTMIAGDQTGMYYTLQPQSAITFDILVVARDKVTDEMASYKFTGAAKRDSASNSSIIGTVTKLVIAEDDVTWDCNVTVDNTTNTLVITVIGAATNQVSWAASSHGVEVFN